MSEEPCMEVHFKCFQFLLRHNWGEAKENCWWGAQPQFTHKQTSFDSNLLTKWTFLDFYHQYNIDEHY